MMGEETTRGTLAAKMAAVMGKINRVPKNGFNAFHKYAYATESDITDAVRSLLAEQQVFIFSSVRDVTQETVTDDRGRVTIRTRVWVDFTFMDGETGDTFVASYPGEGHDPGDKGVPKALTTATKYFLLKTFLIPTGDDPEADTHTDERAEEASHAARSGKGEASKTTGVKAPPKESDTRLTCTQCGQIVTQAVATFSEHKFGRTLCQSCQKEAKSA